MIKDVAFVLPVYNESSVIKDVLTDLKLDIEHIICVDDSSDDSSPEQILESGAYLVSHPINMGQGAAIQTGIEFALKLKEVNYIVTFDADGQHRKIDAIKMVKELKRNKTLDVILGSRFLGGAVGIRKSKQIILKLGVIFTNITTGLKLTDTHNGLRAFTRQSASKINITLPGMAHASEILSIINEENLTYKEMPVTIDYTEYSLSKGQSSINAINIISEILVRRKK